MPRLIGIERMVTVSKVIPTHPRSWQTLEPLSWAKRVRRELARAEDDGYFGPSSAIWRVNREVVVHAGIGRALLMQLAHPWVAQAVKDHSSFGTNAVERFLTSIEGAELLVFGSRAQANATASRIRQVHTRIKGTLDEDVGRWSKGTSYHADDPDALLWVLTTLADTALLIHGSCFGPMPDDLANAYLADTAQLGSLLGVPKDMMPRDRTAMEHYIRNVIQEGTVAVGMTARSLAREIVSTKLPPLLGAGRTALVHAAILLLPWELRSQYGLELGRRNEAASSLLGLMGTSLIRYLPVGLRGDPIARRALERTRDRRHIGSSLAP